MTRQAITAGCEISTAPARIWVVTEVAADEVHAERTLKSGKAVKIVWPRELAEYKVGGLWWTCKSPAVRP